MWIEKQARKTIRNRMIQILMRHFTRNLFLNSIKKMGREIFKQSLGAEFRAVSRRAEDGKDVVVWSLIRLVPCVGEILNARHFLRQPFFQRKAGKNLSFRNEMDDRFLCCQGLECGGRLMAC